MITEKRSEAGAGQGPEPRMPTSDREGVARRNVALDCGWGRLLFGQTFENASELAACIRAEGPGRRDIAFYILDPHVVLAAAPQELFLDPSHTYRLDLSTYKPAAAQPRGFYIRRLGSVQDAEEVNRIYAARGMVTVAPDFFWSKRDSRAITYLVAEDEATGGIAGTITGIDHHAAFGDFPTWLLAVVSCRRSAGHAAGHRRGAGAAARRAFQGAGGGVSRSLGDARQ
jgi:ribosomal protein S18 acetylase RimI-like enzyme